MKIFSRLMVGILLTLSVSGLVFAQDDTTTTTPTRQDNIKAALEANVDYDVTKSKILNLTDLTINRLEQTQVKLANRNLSAEVYPIVNQALTDVLALLNTYKTTLEATTSYEEMAPVNTEFKKNLSAILTSATFDVAEAQLAYFQEFQSEIDQYADSLVTVCPDQTELTSEITTALETALANEDIEATKASVKSLTSIAEKLAKDVAELESVCLQ